jgi:hypothetical protein
MDMDKNVNTYIEKIDSFQKINTVKIDVKTGLFSVDHHIIKVNYKPETTDVETYYIFTSGDKIFSTPIPQTLKGGENIKSVIKREIRKYDKIKSVDIEGVKK